MNMKNKTLGFAKIIVTAALFSMLFFSCAGKKNPAASSFGPVYVTNSNKIFLLYPSSITDSLDNLFLVTGRFGGNTFTAQLYHYADDSELSLELMNDFGISMGSLSYTESSLDFNSSVFPRELKGEYVVSDIQAAFYDFDTLSYNFECAGLKFLRSVEEGREVRTIEKEKNGVSEKIETITLSDGKIVIENHLRGYSYQLDLLEE
jgi:hypothetical protein